MLSPDELRRWDREIVWHAFTQMAEYEPLMIERAEGCTLIDIDGRRVSRRREQPVVQHPRPSPSDGSTRPFARNSTESPMSPISAASNPTTIRLAKRLVDLAPPGLRHVFFSDDGATAVEVALKMAFQYWRQRRGLRTSATRPGEERLSTRDNGSTASTAYHGDTLGSVSVGGVERFHAMFRPLLFETLRCPAPDTYRTAAGRIARANLPHIIWPNWSNCSPQQHGGSPRW